ncbi:MAG TPA: signal recognition particle-docking protein FtsY [Actinomycetota bacterium]
MELVLVAIAAIVVVGALVSVIVLRRGRTSPSREVAPSAGSGVLSTRQDGLAARVRSLFAGGATGQDEWARLEELLVRADVGPQTAARIVRDVRARYTPSSDPVALLHDELVAILGGDGRLALRPDDLSVVMVVGVNGSGKTTTIGKLAARLSREGRKVSLANSDTFRAAAAEQLDVWAQRAGATLVSQKRGADPGAVAFDAVQAARARGRDVLIVDTAGRIHTKQPLMEELSKVKRVLEKASEKPVDEVLLVVDATTGQNGIAQARTFLDAVEVTGIALTKLDGSARGGVVLAIRDELGLPVKLVGTGEGIDDLQPFDGESFAADLVG